MTKLINIYMKVVLAVFPFVYLPVVTDMYGTGKLWWWVVLAGVGLIMWGVGLLVGKKDEVRTNGVLWILGLMAVWSLISFLRMTIGVQERTMWGLTGVAVVWGILTWYFLLLQSEIKTNELNRWLRVVGVMLAAGSVVMFLMPEKNLPISWPQDNPFIVISQSWSLTGSILGEAILLAYLVLINGKQIVERMKKGQGYIGAAVMTAFMSLGLCLDLYRMSKMGLGVLDVNSSWAIAVETFKRSPLWGVGPGNFVQAFNLLRPSSFNMTPLWSSLVGVSAMTAMQLWTELGLVGLVTIILLFNQLFRVKEKGFGFWVALAALVSWLVLPFNMVGTLVMLVALVGVCESRKVKMMLAAGESNFNLMPYITVVMAVVISGVGLFKAGRFVVGEHYLRQSLVAAAKNDGGTMYEWQRKLVNFAPNMPDYRKAFSQTNMALAQGMMTKKELTDEEKQKVSVLLQQTVSEAKAAIALDSNNSVYWANLATLYRSMVGIVDGSVDWSAQAYQQAIMLDPTNPLLGLDYGGLLFGAGSYEAADRVFEQAVNNKPDFANAWYNWAHSAKKLNKLVDAVNRMSQALTYVQATSGDYEKASKELDAWKKEYDEAVKKQQAELTAKQAESKTPETLKTPEALPTGSKESKVAVPTGEMAPPATPTP